jgi:hypothetical protein
MSEKDAVPAGETAGRDFIRQIIDEDVKNGKHKTIVSRTDISTSGTPNPFASISDWRRSTAAGAICALTTPTRKKRAWSMWIPL